MKEFSHLKEMENKKRKIEDVDFTRDNLNLFNPLEMDLTSEGEPISMKPSEEDEKHKEEFTQDQFYLFSALPLTDDQKKDLIKHLRRNT
tara:strand:+ start:3276 stop:3542 length:267 start_codon:yes stop_codon:yes gene_type:complete